MTSKVQDQANKVKNTIFSPATTEAYSTAIALTWTILKETAQLLWLVVCLGLVFGDWFWKKSYQTGQSARVWVDDLQHRQQTAASGESTEETKPSIAEAITTGEFWSNTGKSLLEASKTATTLALATAKNQLGIEVAAEPTPVLPQPVAKSAPTAVSSPAISPTPEASPTAEQPEPPTFS